MIEKVSSERKIRVYFESLEQALHLVVPLIRKGFEVCPPDLPVDLVRVNWSSTKDKGPIDAFRTLNSPDILVTIVAGEGTAAKEQPLFALEISVAVKTEDHELQRATVVAASLWSGITSVKLSGERKSDKDHGGNKNFNPLSMARLFQDTAGHLGYFYQEWATNGGTLLLQPGTFSCPPLDSVPILSAVAQAACVVSKNPRLMDFSSIEAGQLVVEEADKLPAIKKYRKDVSVSEAEPRGLVGRILRPSPTMVDPGTTIEERATVATDKTLYVKLNRFDHQGDPDRGVIIALSTGWKGRTIVLYKMEGRGKTKNRSELQKAFENSVEATDAFLGFGAEEGVQRWLLYIVKTKAKPGKWINISDDVHANKLSCASNSLIRTLLLFSDGILFQFVKNSTVKWFGLSWNRRHMAELLLPIDPYSPQLPRAISKATTANEDEITYATVHQVLKPNGFTILSVSYPGQQGSDPILDLEEEGRTRSRTYVDIVALTPKSTDVLPSLTEAKKSIGRGTDEDVEKLLAIGKESGKRKGLKSLLEYKGFTGWDGRKIILSVAFGSSAVTTWSPSGIDFLVRIQGREKFEVAPFGDARKFFPKTVAGLTGLPTVWQQ